ncbi:RHS repeat domain-containing protein [Chitinophaga rhizophila]|uniref:RHS repeat-associated core domain-containing protein n=1 Tax=Chitinophaga rhizophila TaxID=2866212 RepID=A0ABS7GLE8_9BACT|nr:RHS repeat-associated core domain-containing protein [Chitinophaga rhizophila]MBW8687482.1 hypothetical protein [Chitinophaga rhizophila]
MGGYRYGFNGKENDNEVKGEGMQLDYGSRIYDPRLSLFLTVDPKEKELPEWGTYVAFGDNPVKNIDPDGKKFYDFNERGEFIGITHNNFFHNIFHRTGRIVDKEGNQKRRFGFASGREDRAEIENGTIKRIIIVNDAKLKEFMAVAGAFSAENKTENRGFEDRYDYIKEEGKGGGKLDFSYTWIPFEYKNAPKFPLEQKSTQLYLPPASMKGAPEYAHNHMNFGNYLFGLASEAMGFTLLETAGGAHYNSLFNSKSNNYEPQLDSGDDQRSIKLGFEYGKSLRYDRKLFIAGHGKTTWKIIDNDN